MNFKFKYKQIGKIFRPLINISLKHGGVEIGYIALIDSGADFCIFHSDIASILGIDYLRLKQMDFGGIGKGMQCKGYTAIIDVGIKNYFHSMPIIFSPDIGNFGYGVVGQVGFFDLFKVTFSYKTKDIILEAK